LLGLFTLDASERHLSSRWRAAGKGAGRTTEDLRRAANKDAGRSAETLRHAAKLNSGGKEHAST
jgi:hypothetical protein